MKYVDEFRETSICQRLTEQIRRTATRTRTIMEVCGGQTHGLLRYGLDQMLDGAVRMIHGPGCPVCVTAAEIIDFAADLARRPQVTVASFGDMLRVPGNQGSLLQARSAGGDVRVVYSPLDAVRLAERQPERQVVFFAVGFETTAPATALAVMQAAQLGLRNFFLLVAHVRVLPAMEQLLKDPHHVIEGFLAAGHVCTITGYEAYHEFCARHGRPVVVTGFEPVDLLAGILECVRQIEAGEASVSNRYERSVAEAGNTQAANMVAEIYQTCDQLWRGMGVIPGGGLKLRDAWERFDAGLHFEPIATKGIQASRCRSGEVLSGKIRPTECELFATECLPESPLGAPMVSSEGACAAYYRFCRERK